MSWQEEEFVAVEERSAERRETVRARDGFGVAEFVRAGIAAERELISAVDLFDRVVACVGLHSRGERLGFIDRESAVEQVQRLDRRGGFAPVCSALTGIGTIERAEHRLAFASDFMRI